VHARKAWLRGLSPAQNRTLPPLRHPEIHRLKRDFPHLTIVTNGGIDTVKDQLRRLEKLPVPVVAAINGAALGGGFELCLACNHRIAWDDKSVQLGLPEVTLGLLPGGGGVVRLTKLLGLEKALPYLLEGKRIAPGKALDEGMIHDLVREKDELVPAAKAWILAHREDAEAAIQPWDRKGFRKYRSGSSEKIKFNIRDC